MAILKKILPFILILVFSFFTFKPFFQNGFFPIHDDTQVARVYEMTKALKDGMFPVRWSQDLGYGYGYPLFNFYDPLPYYIGGVSGVIFDALTSTKIMMFLGIILAGFSMYLFSKEYFGRYGGILSSLFYIYAPYHALDIYVRGDVAEIYAYAFIPLIFYGLLKLSKKLEWRYVAITSFSFAGLILSHNLTAMFSLPFIILYTIYLLYFSKGNKFELFKYFSITLILGGLASAFYSLPAIFEMNYTNVLSQIGGGADFRDHFVCLYQLWSSPWGYGGSTKGCTDGLSFMIGKYHIILAFVLFIFSIFYLLVKKISKKIKIGKEIVLTIIFFTFCFLLSVFFTLALSKPVWELIKPMAFIQYPWRFLILGSFFSSFIAGSIIYFVEKIFKNNNTKVVISLILFIAVVLAYSKFFIPQNFINKSENDYTNQYQLNWIVSKTSDEYMPKGFSKPKNAYEIPSPTNLITKDLSVKIDSKKTQSINLTLNINHAAKYVFPIAYFPAWKTYLDNKQVNIEEERMGILVYLPSGNHSLTLKFEQTPLELLSDFLSLTGILILFAGIIYVRPKNE